MVDAKDILSQPDTDPDENPWVHGRPPPETLAVVPYDPAWVDLYGRLAADIGGALGSAALRIDHVGSTAVPGLAAKPVIDLDLVVADPADETAYVPALAALGYDLTVREPGWYQHRCLRLAAPRANLHVFGPDCPEHLRHLLFRDWLRDHPGDRERYAQAKREALPDAADVTAYNARKSAVIRAIYRKAFRAAGYLPAGGEAVVREGVPADAGGLAELWERSVRATHAFLSEDDIVGLRPEVRRAVAGPGVWVAEEDGAARGFMILDGNKVEALFVDPERRGGGLGTRLLDHACRRCAGAGELWVEVNEENPAALAFYQARGFEVTGRSPVDAAGRPFPLLTLKRLLVSRD